MFISCKWFIYVMNYHRKSCTVLVFPILPKRLSHLICHGVIVLAVNSCVWRHDGALKWIIRIIYVLNFTICCMEVWLPICVLFILRWCHTRVFLTVVSNDEVWFVSFSLWPCNARTTMMNIPLFIFIRLLYEAMCVLHRVAISFLLNWCACAK
jgi:hypothetical protein